MKRLIWILCALCCATQLFSQTGNLVLHDDFSDGYEGYSFTEFSLFKSSKKVYPGKKVYRLNNALKLIGPKKLELRALKKFTPINNADYHLSVKLASIAVSEGSFAISFLGKDEKGSTGGYSFILRNSTCTLLPISLRDYHDDFFIIRDKSLSHSQHLTGNSVRKIDIKKSGDNLKVFLNDIEMVSFKPAELKLSEIRFTVSFTATVGIGEIKLYEGGGMASNEGPKIEIYSPASRGLNVVTTEMVNVTGRAIDPDGISKILVNKKQVSVSNDGRFSTYVSVPEGKSTIEVIASDTKGASSSKLIDIGKEKVLAKNSPPEIEIYSPASRGLNVVTTEMVKVTGRAIDPDGISSVTVNGRNANVQADGRFELSISVVMGSGQIIVRATDKKMKSASKTLLVKREERILKKDQASTKKRVALVIGNSNYGSQGNLLGKPVNDANDMAATLRSLGFKVIIKTDVAFAEMDMAIRQFGRESRDADVALFFFAGHGMQINQINYLLPLNARLEGVEDAKSECVKVNRVQEMMESSNSNRLNMIVLDACRNNPFINWERGGGQGLAGMTPPSGTLIAFATSPGSVAQNGTGRNGLYTGELMKQLKKKQRIEDVFINTRIAVEKLSNNQQSPWELARLRGIYFLKEE